MAFRTMLQFFSVKGTEKKSLTHREMGGASRWGQETEEGASFTFSRKGVRGGRGQDEVGEPAGPCRPRCGIWV